MSMARCTAGELEIKPLVSVPWGIAYSEGPPIALEFRCQNRTDREWFATQQLLTMGPWEGD